MDNTVSLFTGWSMRDGLSNSVAGLMTADGEKAIDQLTVLVGPPLAGTIVIPDTWHTEIALVFVLIPGFPLIVDTGDFVVAPLRIITAVHEHLRSQAEIMAQVHTLEDGPLHEVVCQEGMIGCGLLRHGRRDRHTARRNLVRDLVVAPARDRAEIQAQGIRTFIVLGETLL